MSQPRKIGIIGAGFSGVSLAAMLQKYSKKPLVIILCDKTGILGAGDAYKTPYPYHLLNVRAKDMSVYEEDPSHFIRWLKSYPNLSQYLDHTLTLEEQFVPRFLYHIYLNQILQQDKKMHITIHFVREEVVDAVIVEDKVAMKFKNDQTELVDQVLLAIGNNPPAPFPFPVHKESKVIAHPWDYTAPKKIAKNENVLLVGTGLSMIDTVLSLHDQGHEGTIHALSRHGLLPLPHTNTHAAAYLFDETVLPNSLRRLMRFLHCEARSLIKQNDDWRALINAIRFKVPSLWQRLSLKDKKMFIRHALSYWNIHRHRVNDRIYHLLLSLIQKKQLKIIAGRIHKVENDRISFSYRHETQQRELKADWLINCLGPSLSMRPTHQPLLAHLSARGDISFDPLKIGFHTDSTGAIMTMAGHASYFFYSLGSPTKGMYWECTAVPEIRRQSDALVKHLLGRVS